MTVLNFVVFGTVHTLLEGDRGGGSVLFPVRLEERMREPGKNMNELSDGTRDVFRTNTLVVSIRKVWENYVHTTIVTTVG